MDVKIVKEGNMNIVYADGHKVISSRDEIADVSIDETGEFTIKTKANNLIFHIFMALFMISILMFLSGALGYDTHRQSLRNCIKDHNVNSCLLEHRVIREIDIRSDEEIEVNFNRV